MADERVKMQWESHRNLRASTLPLLAQEQLAYARVKGDLNKDGENTFIGSGWVICKPEDHHAWCVVTVGHRYIAVETKKFWPHDKNTPACVEGEFLDISGEDYEICSIQSMHGSGPVNENWLLIYAHPVANRPNSMSEDELRELYE